MTQKLRKGDLRELKSKNISLGSMPAVLPRSRKSVSIYSRSAPESKISVKYSEETPFSEGL